MSRALRGEPCRPAGWLLGCSLLLVSGCGGGPMPGDLPTLAPPTSDGAGETIGPDAASPGTDGAPSDAPSGDDGAAGGPDATDPPYLGAPPDQPAPPDEVGPTCPACGAYDEPVVAGTVSSLEITEVSGIAASVRNPGHFYVHNDSGDTARVFAIDSTAAMVAELVLDAVIARDWEDIAVGPCGAKSCIYVGEIGDNDRTRNEYVIYRIPEPELGEPLSQPVTVSPERFPFVYPDGAHNAEALLVHPLTGEVYLVTKVSLPDEPAVYKFPGPLVADQTATLQKVADLDVTAVCGSPLTAGAIHPCGDRLMLRSRGRMCELHQPPGLPFDATFTTTPVAVPLAAEGQGEAVTYAHDGLGYFTLSEGVYQPLNAVLCR